MCAQRARRGCTGHDGRAKPAVTPRLAPRHRQTNPHLTLEHFKSSVAHFETSFLSATGRNPKPSKTLVTDRWKPSKTPVTDRWTDGHLVSISYVCLSATTTDTPSLTDWPAFETSFLSATCLYATMTRTPLSLTDWLAIQNPAHRQTDRQTNELIYRICTSVFIDLEFTLI
jgi:hypothetical protein